MGMVLNTKGLVSWLMYCRASRFVKKRGGFFALLQSQILILLDLWIEEMRVELLLPCEGSGGPVVERVFSARF
jgi:hypothetical protein